MKTLKNIKNHKKSYNKTAKKQKHKSKHSEIIKKKHKKIIKKINHLNGLVAHIQTHNF